MGGNSVFSGQQGSLLQMQPGFLQVVPEGNFLIPNNTMSQSDMVEQYNMMHARPAGEDGAAGEPQYVLGSFVQPVPEVESPLRQIRQSRRL